MNNQYPKRLIEVDLPIREISRHARREKSIRHGHISTLHIWWARRPLAACRAVICASLWPDPADDACPPAFREAVARLLPAFAEEVRNDRKLAELSQVGWSRWNRLTKASWQADHVGCWADMRYALLDFIADFANWDASTVPAFLETSRELTQAAHEALGGLPGTRPLVVDPFAGGGAIPLEALRVGADAFASDLNPVAVLLNKVVLEYIPKYGPQLANDVSKWGQWVKEQAERELAEYYPVGSNAETPIAYLWARTVKCEGPGCGAEVPLMRSFWLAKKKNRSVAMRLSPNFTGRNNAIDVEVIEDVESGSVGQGTIRRGTVTCPACGYATPADQVRKQLSPRKGGTHDARLMAVVEQSGDRIVYREPTLLDEEVLAQAKRKLYAEYADNIPDEPTPTNKSHRAVGSPWIYGMRQWGDLFTERQLLALLTFSKIVEFGQTAGMPREIQIILGLCVSKISGFLSSLCMWRTTRTCVAQTFSRQALAQVWDFGEMSPFAGSAGDWSECIRYVCLFIDHLQISISATGSAQIADATEHPLPDDLADLFFTDPPYYDSVAYAELSDFFYVWLKRSLGTTANELFETNLTPKREQAIVLHPSSVAERESYEHKMQSAFEEGKRILGPSGICSVVFAHKSTAGWESHLGAIIESGWSITGSWPIDTERSGRVNAFETASLASSIHLVCRPRSEEIVGDWRDVLQELPERIHEWMPRLAREGIVGADAIFACLGPALEIYSRYVSVERADGSEVPLGEYLEYVWAAVSKEALEMVFAGADVTGFEADARLTAMWLWTIDANADEEAKSSEKTVASTGYVLEYDAARKIAQGLGAHLEQLGNLVEVKGSKARLLPVAERTRVLFGKEGVQDNRRQKRPSGPQQLSLLELLPEEEIAELGLADSTVSDVGETVLDRVHQTMLLFGAGQSEAMKRFLVDDGIGRDERFWRLAQALSALYPAATDEKRWVDGVLARKKGLGL